jgi:mRNA interferase RelE/StbE
VFQVRILDAAADDLESLDRPVARRIIQRLQWLAKNLDTINRERLTGQFAGLFKFRIGDYRVIYEVIEEEQLLIVHVVGHRRDIYRR